MVPSVNRKRDLVTDKRTPVVGELESQLLTRTRIGNIQKLCKAPQSETAIVLDEEGICSARRCAYAKYNTEDWSGREQQLRELLDQHRKTDGYWDVLTYSGSKYSSYVAHQLKMNFSDNPLSNANMRFLSI